MKCIACDTEQGRSITVCEECLLLLVEDAVKAYNHLATLINIETDFTVAILPVPQSLYEDAEDHLSHAICRLAMARVQRIGEK